MLHRYHGDISALASQNVHMHQALQCVQTTITKVLHHMDQQDYAPARTLLRQLLGSVTAATASSRSSSPHASSQSGAAMPLVATATASHATAPELAAIALPSTAKALAELDGQQPQQAQQHRLSHASSPQHSRSSSVVIHPGPSEAGQWGLPTADCWSPPAAPSDSQQCHTFGAHSSVTQAYTERAGPGAAEGQQQSLGGAARRRSNSAKERTAVPQWQAQVGFARAATMPVPYSLTTGAGPVSKAPEPLGAAALRRQSLSLKHCLDASGSTRSQPMHQTQHSQQWVAGAQHAQHAELLYHAELERAELEQQQAELQRQVRELEELDHALMEQQAWQQEQEQEREGVRGLGRWGGTDSEFDTPKASCIERKRSVSSPNVLNTYLEQQQQQEGDQQGRGRAPSSPGMPMDPLPTHRSSSSTDSSSSESDPARYSDFQEDVRSHHSGPYTPQWSTSSSSDTVGSGRWEAGSPKRQLQLQNPGWHAGSGYKVDGDGYVAINAEVHALKPSRLSMAHSPLSRAHTIDSPPRASASASRNSSSTGSSHGSSSAAMVSGMPLTHTQNTSACAGATDHHRFSNGSCSGTMNIRTSNAGDTAGCTADEQQYMRGLRASGGPAMAHGMNSHAAPMPTGSGMYMGMGGGMGGGQLGGIASNNTPLKAAFMNPGAHYSAYSPRACLSPADARACYGSLGLSPHLSGASTPRRIIDLARDTGLSPHPSTGTSGVSPAFSVTTAPASDTQGAGPGLVSCASLGPCAAVREMAAMADVLRPGLEAGAGSFSARSARSFSEGYKMKQALIAFRRQRMLESLGECMSNGYGAMDNSARRHTAGGAAAWDAMT